MRALSWLFAGSLVAHLGEVSAFAPGHGVLLRPLDHGARRPVTMKLGISQQHLRLRRQQEQQRRWQQQRRRSQRPVALQQQSWWDSLMSSWFKLPRSSGSVPRFKRSLPDLAAIEDDRAIIEQLRKSNSELRAELAILKIDMAKRGIFVPPSGENDESTENAPPITPPIMLPSKNVQRPPDKRKNGGLDARWALLVGLWAAAMTAGGIFIPIAIGEGAASMLRWLDESGSSRRALPGFRRHVWLMGGRRSAGRRWGRPRGRVSPVLRFVPFSETCSSALEEAE